MSRRRGPGLAHNICLRSEPCHWVCHFAARSQVSGHFTVYYRASSPRALLKQTSSCGPDRRRFCTKKTMEVGRPPNQPGNVAATGKAHQPVPLRFEGNTRSGIKVKGSFTANEFRGAPWLVPDVTAPTRPVGTGRFVCIYSTWGGPSWAASRLGLEPPIFSPSPPRGALKRLGLRALKPATPDESSFLGGDWLPSRGPSCVLTLIIDAQLGQLSHLGKSKNRRVVAVAQSLGLTSLVDLERWWW